jgi:hypothetical protein
MPSYLKIMLPFFAFCALGTVCIPAMPRHFSLSPAQSIPGYQPGHDSTAAALCNGNRSLCVPRATQNMLIANPFAITMTATGSLSDINWELDDQAGKKLAMGKASDDPNWNAGANPSSSARFQLRAYVFVLPETADGVLKVSPVQNGPQGASSELPELTIPVRFESGTSTLPVLVPKSYDQYQAEVEDWASTNGPPAHFAPKSPFVMERLTIMSVSDVVFASAEAAAERASALSQAPVRVLNLAIQGNTAYVDLSLNDLQDHWAGFSITVIKVEALIEKDILQFPHIKSVVFAWPPGTTNSSASLEISRSTQGSRILTEE